MTKCLLEQAGFKQGGSLRPSSFPDVPSMVQELRFLLRLGLLHADVLLVVTRPRFRLARPDRPRTKEIGPDMILLQANSVFDTGLELWLLQDSDNA